MRGIYDEIMPDLSSDSVSVDAESSANESDKEMELRRNSFNDVHKLEQDLQATEALLARKAAECEELIQHQKASDADLHDLTEKLFAEAYKLVDEEKARRIAAEKRYFECKLKVDMLEAEVEALKTAVKNKRNLAQRFLSPGPSLSAERMKPPINRKPRSLSTSRSMNFSVERSEDTVMDPQMYKEFLEWKAVGFTVNGNDKFMKRIVEEDVLPSLRFSNKELSATVFQSIKSNEMEIERCRTEQDTLCALSQTWTLCPYRMKTSESIDWLHISTLTRNRIAAVCDLFTYIRYLSQGLVQSQLPQIYLHITQLRKNVLITKLGSPMETIDNSTDNM